MTKSLSLSLYVLIAVFAAALSLVSPRAIDVHWAAQSSSGEVPPVVDLPNVAIETSTGARTTFAATNGHVRIATMFYAHCPGVCPLTLATLRDIDGGLSERQRSQLRFVLLSLDPARDSPDNLRKFAPGPRWLAGTLLVIFVGLSLWAYSSRRRPAFDAAARLPLEEDRGEST